MGLDQRSRKPRVSGPVQSQCANSVMQKQSPSTTRHAKQFTGALNMMATMDTGPDGALISGDPADEGRITVVYNHGDAPPEITISDTGGYAQTVLANGVAVAVVARADGTRLDASDVLLVERFVVRPQ